MQDFSYTNYKCRECPSMSDGEILNTASKSGEKFYQEICTEMIGNALIIRVEKDPNKKLRKMRENWDPQCDCDMVEIRRPSKGESAKIVNGGESNQILFKVYSKTRIGKDQGNNKPQTIAYKVGACRGGPESNDQCRTITVHPEMQGGPGSQEVHSDHISEGNQDVFLLRIKKKPDTLDTKERNIELELRTPRPPTPEVLPIQEVKVENISQVGITEKKEKVKEIGKEKGKKGKKKKK